MIRAAFVQACRRGRSSTSWQGFPVVLQSLPEGYLNVRASSGIPRDSRLGGQVRNSGGRSTLPPLPKGGSQWQPFIRSSALSFTSLADHVGEEARSAETSAAPESLGEDALGSEAEPVIASSPSDLSEVSSDEEKAAEGSEDSVVDQVELATWSAEEPLAGHVQDGDEGEVDTGVTSAKNGSSAINLVKGQEIVLICEGVAYGGLGVCRIVQPESDDSSEGSRILCEFALPGEQLLAKITKIGKVVEAVKLETITPHSATAEPRCEHFGLCGGCRFQNLEYSAQLALKQQQVTDIFAGLVGGVEASSLVKPIIGAERVYGHLNKVELAFGIENPEVVPRAHGEEDAARGNSEGQAEEDEEGEGEESEQAVGTGSTDAHKGEGVVVLGMRARWPPRTRAIVNINRCHLQAEVGNEIVAFVREYCAGRQEELPVVSRDRPGLLRSLAIRTYRTESDEEQVMLTLSTKSHQPEVLQGLVSSLVEAFPSIKCIVNAVDAKRSMGKLVVGSRRHMLYEQGTVDVKLRGLRFDIDPFFTAQFQSNVEQAELLYREIEMACDLQGDGSEVVWDIFCGSGSIGITLAPKVRHVYGFDNMRSVIESANKQAERSGVANATFAMVNLRAGFPKMAGTEWEGLPDEKPDVAVLNPYRAGVPPRLLDQLVDLRVPRVVLVSSNPASAIKPIRVLCGEREGSEQGPYEVQYVQPLDLFPHTSHVQSVIALRLRS